MVSGGGGQPEPATGETPLKARETTVGGQGTAVSEPEASTFGTDSDDEDLLLGGF